MLDDSADSHRRSNYSVSLLPLVAILTYSKHGAAEDVKHIRFDLPAAIDGIGDYRLGAAPARRAARNEFSAALAVHSLVWKWRASEDETDIAVEICDACPAQGPRSTRMAEPVAGRPRRRFRMRWTTTTRIMMRTSRPGEHSRSQRRPHSQKIQRNQQRTDPQAFEFRRRARPRSPSAMWQVDRWARANGQ